MIKLVLYFIVLVIFSTCSTQSNTNYKAIENQCGKNEILAYYNTKDNYFHNEFKFLFRSGVKDTVTVVYEGKAQRKYIDTYRNYENNFQYFTIDRNKDLLVKISIGIEEYCFLLNKEYYYYDFIKRDNKLYIYFDKLRNRSFE